MSAPQWQHVLTWSSLSTSCHPLPLSYYTWKYVDEGTLGQLPAATHKTLVCLRAATGDDPEADSAVCFWFGNMQAWVDRRVTVKNVPARCCCCCAVGIPLMSHVEDTIGTTTSFNTLQSLCSILIWVHPSIEVNHNFIIDSNEGRTGLDSWWKMSLDKLLSPCYLHQTLTEPSPVLYDVTPIRYHKLSWQQIYIIKHILNMLFKCIQCS